MKKRKILFRAGALVILLAIAGLMVFIGRGHTVIFDSAPVEYQGKTYETPHKISIYDEDGELVVKLNRNHGRGERGQMLYAGPRGVTVHVKVMAEKGGEETETDILVKVPFNTDAQVFNLTGYLAGLPQEAYVQEFVPLVVEEEEPEPSEGDEFGSMDMGGM